VDVAGLGIRAGAATPLAPPARRPLHTMWIPPDRPA
jgi:hypothetical protein